MSYTFIMPASGSMVKSVKTTAYAIGQIIAQNAAAGSCSAIQLQAARRANDVGFIKRARLKVDDATWLNALVRAHLFKNSPTFTNGDAANFANGVTDSNYFGAFDITLGTQFTDFVRGSVGYPVDGGGEVGYQADSSALIYAVLEARSVTAGGHTASKTFTLELECYPS
jgi:hypothetical protein